VRASYGVWQWPLELSSILVVNKGSFKAVLRAHCWGCGVLWIRLADTEDVCQVQGPRWQQEEGEEEGGGSEVAGRDRGERGASVCLSTPVGLCLADCALRCILILADANVALVQKVPFLLRPPRPAVNFLSLFQLYNVWCILCRSVTVAYVRVSSGGDCASSSYALTCYSFRVLQLLVLLWV